MSSERIESHLTNGESTLDKKFIDAKAYLQSASSKSGLNVYDHLSKLLTRLLQERPQDAADLFEDLSKKIKSERYVSQEDTLVDKPEKSSESKLAEIQRSLFTKNEEDEDGNQESDEVDTPLPNLLELAYYFDQAGVGVGKEETYRVWLSLKQLVDKYPLESIRFWGKIFGTQQNYYIAEVQFQEGKDEEGEAVEEAKEEEETTEKNEDGNEEEEDPIPKPNFKPTPTPPSEEYGTGSNKFVYFACNAPGKPWVRLPSVTPLHIQSSRQIKKFFTGKLDTQIVSFPPFNGTEAQYLRAQIARISAGTQISPTGFYRFDEEGEAEGEEEGGRDTFLPNEEFEGIPVRELADPTMQNWVHHVQHILPQGRTKWWNPKKKNDDEEMENDEEAEEDREEPDEPEPELGPALLTPLSEDAEIDGQPAWTAKISSNLVTQYSICVVRSNLWPGAFAFGIDK